MTVVTPKQRGTPLEFREVYFTSLAKEKEDRHRKEIRVIQEEVGKITKEAISAVLTYGQEGKANTSIFCNTCETLRGPEVNYTPMEKLVLALLSASKQLKRYFQAHTVVVITNQPIKQLLSNSEISGRMLKWKFELEGYDI
ncbi:reverse transcriptase domain-containing protein [Tanacetum coccineum]